MVTKVTFVGDGFTRKPPKVCVEQDVKFKWLRSVSDVIFPLYSLSSLNVFFLMFVVAVVVDGCC